MAKMIFFANNNCTSSCQKKELLLKAGNSLQCLDLLKQEWTRESLLPFVRGRDPLQIMDSSAEEIKSGAIDPLLLTFDKAVELMVASPVLIKGPLVQVDGLSIQGTADKRLQRYMPDSEGLFNTLYQKALKKKKQSRNLAKREKSRLLPLMDASFA